MITKWRYKSLYLKKQAYFIARRIPLAWDKNPRRTVLRIEKSLQDLKDDFYIKDFKTNKNKKWEQADFEIFFDETLVCACNDNPTKEIRNTIFFIVFSFK